MFERRDRIINLLRKDEAEHGRLIGRSLHRLFLDDWALTPGFRLSLSATLAKWAGLVTITYPTRFSEPLIGLTDKGRNVYTIGFEPKRAKG